MTFVDYLQDKMYILLLNITCMVFVVPYLYFTGTNADILLLLAFFWVCMVVLTQWIGYQKYHKYFLELHSIMEQLDQKYLFVECMAKQKDSVSKEYYTLFKKMSKSMIESVSQAESQSKEYKEYIEAWVHEIKLPITAIQLIAENNKNEHTRKIISQLEQIDNNVERALYYARSGVVENDYSIKETKLHKVVTSAIAKNKQLFMQNRVQIKVSTFADIVYTDDKWLLFILNQILLNSVKYKNVAPLISIYATTNKDSVSLHIKDNGIGIPDTDITKVFEKGFTGVNGRIHNKATGIGLYLCKKLSQRLGIGLTIQSEVGNYTEVTITFPKGTYVIT